MKQYAVIKNDVLGEYLHDFVVDKDFFKTGHKKLKPERKRWVY